MQTDLIIVSEYCDKCHIDPSFVLMLEEGGLIEIRKMNQESYLLVSQLGDVERYARMYYDLSINVAGIDAIRHLLDRMQRMQEEIHRLRSELDIYRQTDEEVYDETE